jgi:predicted small lipoprotein YifL
MTISSSPSRDLFKTLWLALCLSILAACGAPEPTIPPGNDVFSDDFSKDAGLWETFDADSNASARIADGRMLITVAQPSIVTFTVAAVNLNDFNLTVTTSQLGGGLANGYGIIFHYLDPQNFYRFDISGDGMWAFSRRHDDQWVHIVELTPSPAIHTGYAANVLRVIARDSTFEFYANGVLLDTITDNNLTLGRIGLFASTFDDATTQVAFDDLTIVNP